MARSGKRKEFLTTGSDKAHEAIIAVTLLFIVDAVRGREHDTVVDKIHLASHRHHALVGVSSNRRIDIGSKHPQVAVLAASSQHKATPFGTSEYIETIAQDDSLHSGHGREYGLVGHAIPMEVVATLLVDVDLDVILSPSCAVKRQAAEDAGLAQVERVGGIVTDQTVLVDSQRVGGKTLDIDEGRVACGSRDHHTAHVSTEGQ